MYSFPLVLLPADAGGDCSGAGGEKNSSFEDKGGCRGIPRESTVHKMTERDQ